jgi:hypothetical protein
MIPSDQAPPGQDWLVRRITDLERQVRELAAGRSLEAATIRGGSLRVVDNTGALQVQVGLLPDGTYGLAATNADGETVDLATLAFGMESDDRGGFVDISSTTYVSGPDGPKVAGVRIGASRRCLVIVTSEITYVAPGTDNRTGFMAFNITDAGGNPVLGAGDNRALYYNTNGVNSIGLCASHVSLIGPNLLPAPGLYDVECQYRVSGGHMSFQSRYLTVMPF